MSKGWTLDTLKQHLDSRIDGVEKSAKLALDAADKAATKAENAFEKRMDTTNEWRGALNDQQNTYVTKAQMSWAVMALIAGIGVATAVFTAFGG